MRELSLFTGAGGGVLGTSLLGFTHVGYVEYDNYCQQVLRQRIKDGHIDNAPIFGDVRTFLGDGYAKSYKGMVDVVSAGFPCQPFSVAGKRKASDDERNMWPATLDVINAVRPPIVFLENVPGLLSATVDDESGRLVHYFGEILRDLAENGYDARWCVLGADDVGLIHRRKRVWILAYAQHNGQPATEVTRSIAKGNDRAAQGSKSASKPAGCCKCNATNTRSGRQRCGTPQNPQGKRQPRTHADTHSKSNAINPRSKRSIPGPRKIQGTDAKTQQRHNSAKFNNTVKNPHSIVQRNQGGQQQSHSKMQWKCAGCENIGSIADLQSRPDIPKPLIRGMDDGVAHRVDRTKAIGNGQVPAVVAAAWRYLNDN